MVDDVAAAEPGGADKPALAWERPEQREQRGAGFTAEEATQDRPRPELARHPGDPHPLAGGMDVYFIHSARVLDRHAEQRIGSEHGDARTVG